MRSLLVAALAAHAVPSVCGQLMDVSHWINTVREKFDRSAEVLEQFVVTTFHGAQEQSSPCQVALHQLSKSDEIWSIRGLQRMTCQDFKDAQDREECTSILGMEKKVAAFLEQKKTSEDICGLLKKEKTMEMTAMSQNPEGNSTLSCKLCERFVQLVDQALAQDMQQVEQVRAILGDICDSMSADSKCHIFLKHYDEVVDWLKHDTDPTVVCTRLTMCLEENPVVKDAHACFYCQHITAAIEYVSKQAPDQLPQVRTILKYVCKLAPSGCKCDELEKNFDKIVDWIKQEKQPREICENLNMCKKDDSESDEVRSPMSMALVISTNSIVVNEGDDKKCFYCDYFTTLIEILIQEDPDQVDQVREYADMICSLLGEENPCHTYIDKFDEVIDSLKKGLKPRKICQDLKFCPANNTVAEKANVPVVVNTSLETDDQHACVYCVHITTLIDYVNKNAPDQLDKLRETLKYICKLAPEGCKCDQMDQDFDKIVQLLKDGKHYHEICKELGMCKHRAEDEVFSVLSNKISNLGENANFSCLYCESLTTIVQIIIQQAPDQVDELRGYANLVCDVLGEENPCHKYVNEFDMVVEALLKGDTPNHICEKLKLCKAVIVSVSNAGNNTCAYCDGVITVLQVALTQKPDQVKELREAAGIVCELLPADDTCHDDLKKFDYAVTTLKNGKAPHEVCHDLKFCTSIETGNMAISPSVLFSKENSADKCSKCKENTLLLAAIATQPDGVKTLDYLNESVCRLIAESDECEFVMKHHDLIAHELQRGEDMNSICTVIGDCKEKKSPGKEQQESISMGCLFCDYIAELLSTVYHNDKEVELAKEALETMCVILPPTAQCDVLTSKFDELVQLLRQGESPTSACQKIDLCHTTESTLLDATTPAPAITIAAYPTTSLMEIE